MPAARMMFKEKCIESRVYIRKGRPQVNDASSILKKQGQKLTPK